MLRQNTTSLLNGSGPLGKRGLFMSWTWEAIVIRALLVLGLAGASYHLRPFQLNLSASVALGAILGIVGVLVEIRLERASLKKLIGAVVGSMLGILLALMASHLLFMTAIEEKSVSFTTYRVDPATNGRRKFCPINIIVVPCQESR